MGRRFNITVRRTGAGLGLNFGIGKASGEIVHVAGCDDFFLPGKLARVVEAFQGERSLGMVYHRIEVWNERTGERRDWTSWRFGRPS